MSLCVCALFSWVFMCVIARRKVFFKYKAVSLTWLRIIWLTISRLWWLCTKGKHSFNVLFSSTLQTSPFPRVISRLIYIIWCENTHTLLWLLRCVVRDQSLISLLKLGLRSFSEFYNSNLFLTPLLLKIYSYFRSAAVSILILLLFS